jgi:hypothetical protein
MGRREALRDGPHSSQHRSIHPAESILTRLLIESSSRKVDTNSLNAASYESDRNS